MHAVSNACHPKVIGASTTQLFRNLSISLLPHLLRHPSPEIVVSTVDHEANIASWVYLEKLVPNLTIKYWTPSDSTTNPHLTPESLRPLLSRNTVLVTCTHTSNILGTITPVRRIADLVHTIPGAMLCVDAVAFAPHRQVDVEEFGVDFYAFSWYKVFGPHVAQLYCSRKAQDAAMTSLGHYFKDPHGLEEKLGLAAASYELVQSLPVVIKYIRQQTWAAMVAQEVELSEILLAYLRSKPEMYTIYGEPTSEPEKRVPVISFGVKGRSSEDVVEKVEQKSEFGFRCGHFYSKRLANDLLGVEGVTRVSMLHYNSLEEIEAFVKALDAEVCGGSS